MKLALFLIATSLAFGQAKIVSQPNMVNSGTLPATCSTGDLFWKTGVTAGQNLYGCTAADTWTLEGGAPNLTISKTSSTVLNIGAGVMRVSSVPSSVSAATGTISGSTASSTAYIYWSSGGALTLGHNGATTITGSGVTVATGITGFPADSCPIGVATYTSNVWDTTIYNYGAVAGCSILAVSGGISLSVDAAGVQTLRTPTIALKSYLPLGSVPDNGANPTTAFSANETRWFLITMKAPATFNTLGIYAVTGIGASKGLRAAIANTAGTILYTSNVQTTCANSTICAMTFGSTVNLTVAQYYVGLTTDSTTLTSNQIKWPYQTLGQFMNTVTGASTTLMGTGTAGSGSAGSVAFGASMGTLTKWSGSSTEAIGKLIEVFFDTN